jgi:aminoglycoside phosphotransferase (APT) family kinase protein
MLSPADRAICERDSGLPGLALLLDVAELGRTAGPGPLTSHYLRYKPQTSCAAGVFTATGRAMAAYAYTRERYAEVLTRPKWREDPDVVLCDDACIAMIPARRDRELRTLRRLFDPQRQPKFLRALIGHQNACDVTSLSILRYKPGRRLVARLDVDGHPRAVLKVIAGADYNQALIGAAGAAAHDGARLLGCDASRGGLVMEWIDGDPLCPVAAGLAPDQSAIRETGTALARVHGATFRPADRISHDDDIEALAEVGSAMATLHPGLGRQLSRIAGKLASRLETADCAPALIHGDFSADQIVMSGTRPVILDWDKAAVGDPARDLGTFLARVAAQVADGVLGPDDAEATGAALTDGYGRAAGALPDGVAVQHARALLMLATEGFRIRHPDWPSRTAALLERAEGLLARHKRQRLDPAIPALDDALGAESVRTKLANAIGQSSGDLCMEKPQIMRHKRGRRALVRYELTDACGTRHTFLGKLRDKGLDRRTPALHDALRACGFDGSGTKGVGVPRAVGVIPHLGLWLQEMVPGVGLDQFLVPTADSTPFARTGAALAALHHGGSAETRRWTMADELAVLERALHEAGRMQPDLVPALRAISHRAATTLSAIGEGTACGIHRDFYFDQVIVDDSRIWIVDLDLYAHGDPAIDVGNFLAHLDELGLRNHADRHAFDQQKGAFLHGYRAAWGPADPASVTAQQTVSLARHIHLGMTLPGRGHTVERILEIVAADLGTTEKCQP